MRFRSSTSSLVSCFVIAAFSAACSSTSAPGAGAPPVAADPACAEPAGCPPVIQGREIGTGDGTASSVDLTDIYTASAASKLVDLAFHPEQVDQLWAVGYGDNSIHVGTGIEGDAPAWKRILDPAARHFMHKPPAIAMGTPDRWATCGDNDNGQNGDGSDGEANLFMGPSLFSTDLAILGKRTTGGLGSHEDMLHNTPLCRGIAHVERNVFWVFNAYDRSLDKYDFGQDHGPGADDHSDGKIYRYAAGKVKGSEDGTPSHVVFDHEDGFLYVADTGNGRVVRLDTTKGKKGTPLDRQMEPLGDDGMMTGTDVEEVVPRGVLQKPAGIEIRGGLVYVTDAATSKFHVFDKQGTQVRELATDLPAGSLAGFTFSSTGKVYFADRTRSRIVRIDPK